MQVDGARETKDGIDVVPVVQTRELLLEDEKEEEKREVERGVEPTGFLKYAGEEGFYRGQVGFVGKWRVM